MCFTGFYWFTARGIREGEELLVEKAKTKMQMSHFASSILSFYPVAGHMTVNTSGKETSPTLGSQASLWVCAVTVLYLRCDKFQGMTGGWCVRGPGTCFMPEQ